MMKLVEEYRRRADECRKLVQQTLIPDHRKSIEKICDMWLRLAEERLKWLEETGGAASPKPG